MNGYKLSQAAAAMERNWDRAHGGNVVPLRVATSGAEQRTVDFANVWGLAYEDATAIGLVNLASATDIAVTIESALGVPAVSAAVNFIANELASLPCDLYRRRDGGRESVNSGLATLLHDAPNDFLTSFEWRKGMFVAKLTGGRGLSYIERSSAGTPLSFWPMDPDATTIRRNGWRVEYQYRDGYGVKTYPAEDVIDLPFMLKPDGVCHRGPISMGKDAIGLAIAITQYGSRFFSGGGVPPFAVTGNFQTSDGMRRAADDLARAVKKAASEKRQAVVLPAGHEIKPIGGDPDKAQMVEMQRFCIEQIARLYSIPPTFLQDLTHGTYANTEQQDLHFVKHTLLHHAKQFEQELNLKLFGRRSRSQYVELNMDGLLRGDFKTRMEGWARAIQTGLVMPSEAREAENWPKVPGSDRLFMQGATVPIDQAGSTPAVNIAQGAQE